MGWGNWNKPTIHTIKEDVDLMGVKYINPNTGGISAQKRIYQTKNFKKGDVISITRVPLLGGMGGVAPKQADYSFTDDGFNYLIDLRNGKIIDFQKELYNAEKSMSIPTGTTENDKPKTETKEVEPTLKKEDSSFFTPKRIVGIGFILLGIGVIYAGIKYKK